MDEKLPDGIISRVGFGGESFTGRLRLPLFDKPRYFIFVDAIYISDFHKTNKTLNITSNRDNMAQHSFTCAANTSEHCSFSWRETYRNSSKSSDVLGPTIDWKNRVVAISSARCRAECVIRNKVCVSEPMFIEFPSADG